MPDADRNSIVHIPVSEGIKGVCKLERCSFLHKQWIISRRPRASVEGWKGRDCRAKGPVWGHCEMTGNGGGQESPLTGRGESP